ncbi:hypothetical protein Tco_0829168 [Tanacetum coccineum]
MNFKSFMVEGIDGEFHFEPKGDIGDGEGRSPSNRDSDGLSSEKCVVDEGERLRKSSKVIGKRKQVIGPSVKEARHKLRKAPPQASKVAGDASDPLDVDSDPDIHGHVCPCKSKTSCDVTREREVEKDKAYAELERKCNEALDLGKKPLVLDMRVEIRLYKGKLTESERERLKGSETQLLQEIDKLRQDKAMVVTKVIPHVAIKLIRNDEVGLLVARLVKAAMFCGRCTSFEEVAALKEPFTLDKMPGYRSSSDLATASYPFISEASTNLYAFLEELI